MAKSCGFSPPPEKETEFDALFKNENHAATIRLSKAQKLYMKQHRMRVIHQRAGDIVFVPGGWPHMVKNLTDTVSFGNSFLRPWKMYDFVAFVRQHGLAYASRLVNAVGVIRAWMDEDRQREWGVSSDDADRVMRKWGAWIKTHIVPGSKGHHQCVAPGVVTHCAAFSSTLCLRLHLSSCGRGR